MRDRRFGGRNHRLHLANGIDDVFTDAFGDFDGDSGLTVVAKVGVRIEKRALDVGDIAQRYNTVAADLEGQAQHVFRGFHQARNFHCEPATACVDIACRNELIICRDDPKKIAAGDAIALQARWIDDDLQDFVTLA